MNKDMEKLKIVDENNIIYDGVKYKAVESGMFCDGCSFLNSENDCQFNREEKKFRCVGYSRKDMSNVIWIKDEFVPEPYDEVIARAKEKLKNYLPKKKLPKTQEEFYNLKQSLNIVRKVLNGMESIGNERFEKLII